MYVELEAETEALLYAAVEELNKEAKESDIDCMSVNCERDFDFILGQLAVYYLESRKIDIKKIVVK